MPTEFAAFPPTRVSAIGSLRSDNESVRALALEQIAAVYWRPVYTHLRLKWRLARDDAADRAQQFFLEACERGTFGAFDPARGRFRTYLRGCLDHFAANEAKAAGRIKRGGEHRFVPLEVRDEEGALRLLDVPSDVDLEREFERAWLRGLFAAALSELKNWCVAQGKETAFAIFTAYDVERDEANKLTYDELARRHGVPVTQVTNQLHALRRRLRELVLAKLRDVTGSDDEFVAEARAVLGVDPRA